MEILSVHTFWYVGGYIFTACDCPVLSRIYIPYSTRVANVCPSVAETKHRHGARHKQNRTLIACAVF
jgi:hypothetical protein